LEIRTKYPGNILRKLYEKIPLTFSNAFTVFVIFFDFLYDVHCQQREFAGAGNAKLKLPKKASSFVKLYNMS